MAERIELDQPGRLLHVCISAKKGVCKHAVPSANVLVDHGLEGDAHAGGWHRQVSLLAHEDIEFMRAKGLALKPGAFGENLVIDGLNTDELGVGTQLRVGPVLLEMTQVGKVCHTRCAIYYTTGDCIMPRTGLFARVIEGGEIFPGMPVTITSSVPRSRIQAAVLAISDDCSAGMAADSEPAVKKVLTEELGARVAWEALVPDVPERIADTLRDLAERRVDVIVIASATGISGLEVAPQAIGAIPDRELPGLGAGIGVGPESVNSNALLWRAIVGIRGETLIINVPGSRNAAVKNLRAVVPALPASVAILRNKTSHERMGASRLVTLANDRGEVGEPILAGAPK